VHNAISRKNAAVCKPDITTPELYLFVCILFLFYFTLQLLELPQFQDIIKIKTIGSTYMAASGLNPSRQVKVISLYLHAPSHQCEVKSKQDRQGKYGVPMWHIRVTTA
jgi:hypothetical protein